jgi:hypothetical protein
VQDPVASARGSAGLMTSSVTLKVHQHLIFARLTASKPDRIFRLRFIKAPVAQLDRVPDYESGGRMFESCRVHHSFSRFTCPLLQN